MADVFFEVVYFHRKSIGFKADLCKRVETTFYVKSLSRTSLCEKFVNKKVNSTQLNCVVLFFLLLSKRFAEQI